MEKLFWFIPTIGELLLFTRSCSTENTPVYELTTHAEPSDAGTVIPGNIETDEGGLVSILTNANEHQIFIEWSGDHTGTMNPASILMDRTKVLQHYSKSSTIYSP